MKRVFCLILLLLFLPFLASAENRVFLESETEPFPEGAELLTLRVAGMIGGDCMLLSYGDETMFIDVGFEDFLPQIKKLLSEAGEDKHVDTIFNTHPHRDHINGLFAMLENGYSVGRICTVFAHDYDDGKPSCVQLEMIQAAEKNNIPVVDMKTGDTFSFGPAEITVLRLPDNKIYRTVNTNDRSALLMIRYGECSMLLAGDCERRAQSMLPHLYDMKADILKVPHHGLGVLHWDFLKNVDPEFMFITNGSTETKRGWQELNRLRYTRFLFASWGEITIRTDGTRWIVSQKFRPEYQEHGQKHLEKIKRK